jgi:hypothetical protein
VEFAGGVVRPERFELPTFWLAAISGIAIAGQLTADKVYHFRHFTF